MSKRAHTRLIVLRSVVAGQQEQELVADELFQANHGEVVKMGVDGGQSESLLRSVGVVGEHLTSVNQESQMLLNICPLVFHVERNQDVFEVPFDVDLHQIDQTFLVS